MAESSSSKCLSGCGFWGNSKWNGYCSACYKLQPVLKENSNQTNALPKEKTQTVELDLQTPVKVQNQNLDGMPSLIDVAQSPDLTEQPGTVKEQNFADGKTEKSSNQQVLSDNKCKGGCGFFGNPAMGNYCSVCYKTNDKIISAEPVVAVEPASCALPAESVLDLAPKQLNKSKCYKCSKKTGLLGFECRCGYFFCSKCRYAEEHGCQHNFLKDGRDKLAKDNKAVVATKLQRIDSS